MRGLRVAATILTFVLAAGATALAQGRQTTRFVVPLAAGGSYDLMARLMADKLSQKGGAVVVENQAGAGMVTGGNTVAQSAPDGQTIGLLLSPITVQPALIDKMPFDIAKDLAPVTLIGWNYNVLVVSPSLNVSTVAELVAYLKANPDKVNFGSGGNATPAHLAGELFKIATGTQMQHVPYRGIVLAIQDMLADRIQVIFGNAPDVAPHIEAGKMKALAVVGPRRLDSMPNVPSMVELGLPQINVPAWAGIAVAGNTPKDVVARLRQDMLEVLALPDVKQRLAANNTVLETSTPEEFHKLIVADIERWGRVVREAKISVK